jgi:RHS repeat-associated protein
MTAAKEELHVFSLAAFRLFDEKPRPGHQLSTAVLYPGIGSINSSTTTGIAASLYDFRGGPRCTSKERDAESGLDYFGARYFSSAQGRFTSPDWSAKPQPVPYADLSDPQTLNLYGYVRNNPLARTDPDGHCGSVEDCLQSLKKAVDYVKSVAYLKTEGGFGVGVKGTVGPVKGGVEFKNGFENRAEASGSTRKAVVDAGLKVEVGPAKAGLAVTGERLLAKDDERITNGKTEWTATVGVEAGKVKQSGWDIGVGISGYVVIGGGIEVGVNGAKVVRDAHDFWTPPPPAAPDPPRPPAIDTYGGVGQ